MVTKGIKKKSPNSKLLSGNNIYPLLRLQMIINMLLSEAYSIQKINILIMFWFWLWLIEFWPAICKVKTRKRTKMSVNQWRLTDSWVQFLLMDKRAYFNSRIFFFFICTLLIPLPLTFLHFTDVYICCI